MRKATLDAVKLMHKGGSLTPNVYAAGMKCFSAESKDKTINVSVKKKRCTPLGVSRRARPSLAPCSAPRVFQKAAARAFHDMWLTEVDDEQAARIDELVEKLAHHGDRFEKMLTAVRRRCNVAGDAVSPAMPHT